MKRHRLIIAIGAISLAPAAVGQASRPSLPASAPPQNEPLLAGPSVSGEATENVPARNDRRARLPLRRWAEIVYTLDLNAAQKPSVDRVLRELRRERKAFNDGHGREVRELRKLQREARESGKPLPREIRTKLRDIQRKAPSVEAAQEKIWDLLEPDQRDALQEAVRSAEEARRRGRADDAEGMSSTEKDTSMSEAPTSRPSAEDSPERALRRLRFLRRHQAPGSAGGEPSADERRFEFDEEE